MIAVLEILIVIYLCIKMVIQVFIVIFQSTPLHLAAGYNRTRIVQLLIQHGADVHAKDKG